MEKSTIHQLTRSSSRQVSELAAGRSTVMLDLTREMTGIDHTPLITTKLHMPRPRAQLVSRSQLAERLQQGMTDALTLVSAPAAVPTPRSTVLVEPLTERELEALHLIAAGASNEEIAEQLVIAIGTAKRHVSNIFGKLTVSNRTQAVARAREIGLL